MAEPWRAQVAADAAQAEAAGWFWRYRINAIKVRGLLLRRITVVLGKLACAESCMLRGGPADGSSAGDVAPQLSCMRTQCL